MFYDQTRLIQAMEERNRRMNRDWRKIKWCATLSILGLCTAVVCAIVSKQTSLWTVEIQFGMWLAIVVFAIAWLTFCVLFERFKQESNKLFHQMLSDLFLHG